MKGEKHKEFAVTWVFQIIWGRYLRGNLLINQTQTSDQIQPNNLPAKPDSRAVCFVLGQGRVLKSVTWVSLVAQMVKNPPVNAGDMSSILALGRSPLESPGGNVSPLQYSCLKNSTDRGTWQATVHAVTKSWTPLTNTFTSNVT